MDDTEPISLMAARLTSADASRAHARKVERLLEWTLLGREMSDQQLDEALLMVRTWLPESGLPATSGVHGLRFRGR